MIMQFSNEMPLKYVRASILLSVWENSIKAGPHFRLRSVDQLMPSLKTSCASYGIMHSHWGATARRGLLLMGLLEGIPMLWYAFKESHTMVYLYCGWGYHLYCDNPITLQRSRLQYNGKCMQSPKRGCTLLQHSTLECHNRSLLLRASIRTLRDLLLV